MSADIDRIGSSLILIHETYGSCLDLALAFWLLYRLLDVAMAAPIAWTVGKLGLLCYLFSFDFPLVNVLNYFSVPCHRTSHCSSSRQRSNSMARGY